MTRDWRTPVKPPSTPVADARRPTWDDYLMGAAVHAAKKSKDPNTQVGAALVGPEGEVRLTAFNGPPKGVTDNPERLARPKKYLFVAHAEANLISFAARAGITTAGCTVYCTHPPCAACARSMIQAGVWQAVHLNKTFVGWEEQYGVAKEMFEEVGGTLRCIEIEPEAAPLVYTQAVGEAASAYLRSCYAEYDPLIPPNPLPPRFHWRNAFEEMLKAARAPTADDG